MAMHAQTRRNLEHYGELAEGRSDYWRLMAAPRARVKTIVAALREIRPTTVLDLGCGDGSLLLEVARELEEVKLIGVDLSSAQIEENKLRAPAIDWYAGNIEDPAFRLPGDAHAIVCSEVIEHLAEPLRFLAALHGQTTSGTVLVLSTQSGRVGETERRVGHLRHFTATEMRELLTQAGWRPERVWNAGFPFHDLSKWAANVNPDASMREFAGGRYGLKQRFAAWVLRVLFAFNSQSRGAQLFAIARKP